MGIFKKKELTEEELRIIAHEQNMQSWANFLNLVLYAFILGAVVYFLLHSGENMDPGGRYYKGDNTYIEVVQPTNLKG